MGKERIKNNIFSLITYLKILKEMEKEIIKELNMLSKEYDMVIDLENYKVDDWGKLDGT